MKQENKDKNSIHIGTATFQSQTNLLFSWWNQISTTWITSSQNNWNNDTTSRTRISALAVGSPRENKGLHYLSQTQIL